MKIINLTEHDLDEVLTGTTIAQSGQIARVLTSTSTVETVAGIPVMTSTVNGIIGLPEPVEGTVYVVSSLTYNYVKDRADVYSVGTVVKDKVTGKIIGCKGLRR